MHARFRDIKSIHIFAGVPEAYPIGFPVDGEEQIPCLTHPPDNSVPEYLCAFDQLSRAPKPEETALHFYRADEIFQAVISNPEKYLEKFAKFRAVLTPDCSLTLGMSPSKRAHQTLLSRAVGAIWQSRGINVIPSLRWSDSSDYDLVTSGLNPGGTLAISSYGSMRDAELRRNFEMGAREIVTRLMPTTLLFYGAVSRRLLNDLNESTEVRLFRSPTSVIQKSQSDSSQKESNQVLFEGPIEQPIRGLASSVNRPADST